MNFKPLIIILAVFLLGCQNTSKQAETKVVNENDSLLTDTTDVFKVKTETVERVHAVLALSSNALQVVSQPSGSTREIPMGMGMDKVLEVVSKVLTAEIPEPQVNTECGAGPMTMSVFNNGLVLMFQKSRGNQAKLEFVGWSLSKSSNDSKLNTMANIGIGSTRAELESAYKVEIKKTSLGMEFATIPDGLYGIIDGPSESSKISFMWSGLSCNFR